MTWYVCNSQSEGRTGALACLSPFAVKNVDNTLTVSFYSLGQLGTFALIKLLTLGWGTLFIKMRSYFTLKFK